MGLTNGPVRVVAAIQNLHGGGAERAVLNIALGLDPARVDFQLFVHEREGDFLDKLPPHCAVTFATPGPYSRWNLPRITAACIRVVRHVDVVLGAVEGRATAIAFLAGKLLRKPVVGLIENDWAQLGTHVSWRSRQSLKLCGLMERVVSCSTGVEASIRRIGNVDAARSCVIYNAVPVKEIRARALEPLPDDLERIFSKPTIVNVGRLEFQKGQEFLVEAHAMLVKRGVDHNLVIVGKGSRLDELKNLAHERGVADTVHLVGFRENPFSIIRRGTLFVLSSRFEGFALATIEAMACGTAVVSADCPSGAAELLGGGEFGRLVRPEEPAELAAAIGELLADEARREHFRAAGLARCAAFDVRPIGDRWATMFEDVVGRANGRS